MKKVLRLKAVSAQIVARDFGAFGEDVWFVHTLADGIDTYKHWSKASFLGEGEGERVIAKVGKHGGAGKPISRMVNIVCE